MLIQKLVLYLLSAGCLINLGIGNAADTPGTDWHHGARRGVIAQLFSAETPADALPTCLAQIPKNVFGQRQFMRIEYRHVRHLFSTIAEVPEGQTAQAGQRVEVWPVDCAPGKFARIGQIFPVDAKP